MRRFIRFLSYLIHYPKTRELRASMLYQVAWSTLSMVFGEYQNDEALETMEAVLEGVKVELEEGQSNEAI